MTIEVSDLPAKVGEVMAVIDAGGEVIVTDAGRPKARIGGVPAPAAKPARKLGLGAANGYWMAPDFTAELPDGFWLGGRP